MAEGWSVDKLQRLTRRLARALISRDDPDSRELDASIFRLDRCLIDIRNNYPPAAPLLWIDDVGAALESALHFLKSIDPLYNDPRDRNYSTTITSSTATNNESKSDQVPPPTTPLRHLTASMRLSHASRQQDHSRSTSFASNRSRRQSIASLFSSQARSSRRLSNASRSHQSTTFASSISSKVRNSISKFMSPSPPPPEPSRSQTIVSAISTVNEWVAAVHAAKEDHTIDDAESWISLSDALPPLPQQFTACRDNLYQCARDALIKASQAVPTTVNERSRTTTVALVGPHGVGKTMLAMELVHDVDLCHSFADGVAWIQLGPDINDEELADQIIRCVETIVAGDFRSTVRYCSSLESIVARASRLLRRVSSLVVIDDVSGPNAQRAFDIIVSALGASSVALYTSPVDSEETVADVLSLERVTCVAKLFVRPLEPKSAESKTIFRSWLTKTQSEESFDTMKRTQERISIIASCHGLPLALAMAAGFLSKFHTNWPFLAQALLGSQSGDEAIFRILNLLKSKGGVYFQAQLRDIACLPQGVWVSLSAVADIWGMDYRSVKTSARRLGRMAFAEYRLGDSSDDSRVRFHWHILRFCRRCATAVDQKVSNRKMLTNVHQRRKQNLKPRTKVDYLPWWAGCMTDSYMCRRLHWHISRADAVSSLRELICDYEWICQRMERDGLLGVISEFSLAIASEQRQHQPKEAMGLQAALLALREAAKLRKDQVLEMNALPTFLISRLQSAEKKSDCIRDFLNSIYHTARRPWLRPMPSAESSTLSPQTDEAESESESETESVESDFMPYTVHCLTSSSSGKIVFNDREENIHVYDPTTGRNIISWSSSLLPETPQKRIVSALSTIQDFVLSGHASGQLHLRSIRSGRTEVVPCSFKEDDRITCVTSTDDGIIAAGSQSGKLFILDRVEDFGSKPTRTDLEGHCAGVASLHIFPDHKRIASSSYDGFAAIWDVRSTPNKRISLNGHKPDMGHKENYIATFATMGEGKRLLSSCRGGVVNAWDTETGECVWTHRYGFQFSRSLSLQAFGIRLFTPGVQQKETSKKLLHIGYPYVITRGEGPQDLLVLSAGKVREILATVTTEQVISTWLEVYHPASQRIYVAVSYADGRLSSYELVTSLR